MAKCMLLDADLEKKYWAEAVNTANYLQNILPTKPRDKTPYQLWHSKIPDVKNLHIFGAEAYAHVPKECRRKLDEKAEKLKFVGYSEESKALRLLNPSTSKVVISRDVIFLEDIKYRNEEISFQQDPQEKENEENVKDDDCKEIQEDNSQEIQENIQVEREPKEKQRNIELRRSNRSNKGVPPDKFMGSLW